MPACCKSKHNATLVAVSMNLVGFPEMLKLDIRFTVVSEVLIKFKIFGCGVRNCTSSSDVRWEEMIIRRLTIALKQVWQHRGPE